MTERIQKMKAAGLMIVIFAAGLIAGLAIFRLTLPPRHGPGGPKGPPGPEQVLGSFQTRLQLSDEQRQQVRLVLQESRQEADKFLIKVRPDLEISFKRAQAKIRVLLDPTQAKAFDQMIEEFERGPHHPPPHPPIIPPPGHHEIVDK